ncbi:MAG TPA: replication initiation factor domain-containing protein, partial [Oculatellaceae cyanobacterium]
VGLDRFYVAVTGGQAENVFALTMGCPGYYTRLDLQITVEFKVAQPDYVERQYQRWINHGHPGHSPKAAKFVQSGGGSTMYLGTRQNETYYRLYDKSTWYNQDLGTSLRFECEYHRSKADDVAFTIATSNNFKKAVASLVFGSWHLADVRVPVNLIDPLSPLKLDEKVKGSDHYLAWLKSSVRPVVAHLRSLGLDDKIGEVLGLQRPLDL